MPPRKSQVEAMNWMVEHKKAKYLILEMPVGSGKSLLGMTFSRYRGNSSFALTPQIILQKQYENDFETDKTLKLSSFYGKSNYQCYEKGVSCAAGSLIKPRCQSCPYLDARKFAQNANNTVMNYTLGLSVWSYTNMYKSEDGSPKTRNLTILDEAHKVEHHLVQFDTVIINENWCLENNISIPKSTEMSDIIEFIRDKYNEALINAYEQINAELEFIKETKNTRGASSKEMKKTKELNFLESQITVCHGILKLDVEDVEKDYVLITSPQGIELKRLYGKRSFKTIMDPMSKQMLFMSSTILNKDDFCRDLGINPKEAEFLSLESEFDAENRPVLYMPRMKMNYGWNKPENAADRKEMLATIKKICDMNEGESGVIHSGNFAVAEWLCEELNIGGTHEIIQHNPSSKIKRNDAIQDFIETSTPSVLISPSSTEGLDLKDDLARFAIFVKVPFGNMGDAWIKKRMQISSEWYQRQAMIEVIQGGGRIVRTPDDWGTTFILDGSFGYLYQQNKHKVPKWWKSAYQQI